MPEPAAHDLFDGASRAVLSRFGYTVLAPIVKIFMRFGWSARDFSDLARWVFVKAFYATPEFWRHGRPTALQGAIKTGLPRQQVKLLNDIPEPQQVLFTQRQNLAYRVIEGWVNDPDFHTNGKPAALPLRRAQGPTFNKLVMKYGNDVTMYAVLGDLCDVGCVVVNDDIATLVNQAYGINLLNEDVLEIAGYASRRLGETIDHNITHPRIEDRRVQRLWWQTYVPEHRLSEAIEFLKTEIVKNGRSMDAELAKMADAKPVENVRYYEIGFGVYLFQDDATDNSSEFQEDLMKRSTFK